MPLIELHPVAGVPFGQTQASGSVGVLQSAPVKPSLQDRHRCSFSNWQWVMGVPFGQSHGIGVKQSIPIHPSKQDSQFSSVKVHPSVEGTPFRHKQK